MHQAAADALLGLSTQQSVVEEDQLSFSSGRDEVDDDAVLLTQQPEPEPEAVKFTFSYKAVNGKEKLPGSFTAVRDTETFPREWLVLKLEATASYEKMRASDTQTSEVESGPDLEELMGLIRLWRSNWPNRALTLDFVLHVEEIEDSRSDSEPEPEPQQSSLSG
ncbi:hypothetical protein M501DRAFT_997212 [Patellaria atrata CBS 101060]|uniref:Uncharacterized protein n=1 Tax=Patellaria atrata CBS 101060 TaxID=1346257 RepID=A0A9P4S4G2_9PEZI|nr:hypothetical protein M501DRAFT_997212 [Patellaria atrata CBS 101060]